MKPSPTERPTLAGYSTKYALSNGIEEVTVEIDRQEPKYVFAGPTLLVRDRDFFESREVAEANAKQQAARKIASLKKSLANMENLAANPRWKAKAKGDK